MQKKLAVWAQDPDFRFDDIYNLLYDRDWLHRAYSTVRSNSGSKTAGVDGQTISDFEASLEGNIEALARSLKREEFAPRPVRRTYIPKGDGRKRPLGIPTVKDRIVQEALRMALEPIYETDFDQYSFGFRPGRRTHDAIKAAYLAMNNRKKMFWVIDADIEGFFDNVDHQTLEQILQSRISAQSVRDLIWRFLKAGVMEDGKRRYPTSGTPQGGIVSPLLANIYLHELDRWAGQFTHLPKLERNRRRRRGKGNWRYIRYADDFLLLTNGSRKNAETMKKRVSGYLSDQLNLTLSSEKTTVVHANDGFDFLGYHLQRKKDGRGGMVAKWTIPKAAKKEFKDKVRAATAGNADVSVRAKIRALNRIIRGWSSYYRYATDASGTFGSLDYFVWERLMDWLATKYRSSFSEVWDNHLECSSPITINGRSIVQMQGRSTVYGETHTKEGHPYLTDDEWERESLPQGTYWLSNVEARNGWPNVEARNGWRDQRWKALERDEWTCQNCGTDLEEGEPRVHHKRSRSGYSNEREADRLGNLVSLCASCHHQVEANR